MILGPEICLHTLAIGSRTTVDVVSSLIAADEADGLDSGFVQDKVDGVVSPMDDVEDSVREPCLPGQFRNDHGRTRAVSGQQRFLPCKGLLTLFPKAS